MIKFIAITLSSIIISLIFNGTSYAMKETCEDFNKTTYCSGATDASACFSKDGGGLYWCSEGGGVSRCYPLDTPPLCEGGLNPELPDDAPLGPNAPPDSPDKPCTDAGMVMTMTGQCAPPDQTWPPGTPGCGGGAGASLTVVGFGGKSCAWPGKGTPTTAPDGGAADDPFQNYTPEGKKIITPDALGLTPSDQPFDGQIQSNPNGGDTLLVGDGCSTGGRCTIVDFDNNGDIYGFTEIMDDGSMVGGFTPPQPASGFEPYFASSNPSRSNSQPVDVAVPQDSAWNPDYTGPLSPNAGQQTGDPVYSSSGQEIGRVRTVSSGGVSGASGDGAKLYYDAQGNLCGGSRPCGYDTSVVNGEGIVVTGDVNTGRGSGGSDSYSGGGSGDGGDGDGDGPSEYVVKNPCSSDADCWGDGSGPSISDGSGVARSSWGKDGGASGLAGNIYSPEYGNAFGVLYSKWRPVFNNMGWGSWIDYVNSASSENQCPQPPSMDLTGGEIIGGFGVQQVEIDCAFYDIGRSLLAIAASLGAAFLLLRN